MFKLTKLEQNAPSMITQGQFIFGDLWQLWEDEKGNLHRDAFEKLSVIEGSTILVVRGFNDFIKTSPVQEILSVTDTIVTFRTRTSIYELEKVIPENDDQE